MKTHQQVSLKVLAPVVKQYEADGASEEAAVRDLLTDIRHYCQAKRLDFYQALDGSYDVYCDERQEDLQPAKSRR